MKKTLLTVSLMLAALAPAVQAASVSFPDVVKAKETAKSQGKPALILWYGSDWMQDSAGLVKEWNALCKQDIPVVFGQFDDKTGQTSDARRKTMGELKMEGYNLPMAVLLAPDGTFVACYDGKTVRSADAMAKALKKMLEKVPDFMKKVEEARKLTGKDAATAAGKALAMLPEKDARRHKELNDILRKQDKDNAAGYTAVYAMDHMAMYKEINNVLKGGPDGNLKDGNRKFAAAEKYVLDTIKASGLDKGGKKNQEAQQQWLAGLSYVYREHFKATKGEGERSRLLKALDDCIKVNPKSQYGIGAAKYRHYWDPKSFTLIENMYYNPGDQTHNFEKDWHVVVTKSISGAGTYVFELVPRENGRLITRNYRLAINGRVVGTANSLNPKDDTKKAEFTVPAVKPGDKVEVWLTAECRDGWFGCSGEIKMEKK